MNKRRTNQKIGVSLFALLLVGSCGWCLEPDQILVVANKNFKQSVSLAEYYMEKRNIHRKNLVSLRVTDKEKCDRQEYDEKIAEPVRSYLQKNDPGGGTIRCLALVYGVPLAVKPPAPDREEKKKIEGLSRKLEAARKKAANIEKEKDGKKVQEVNAEITELRGKIDSLEKSSCEASVDSELALVQNGRYPLAGWLPNPHFLWFRNKTIEHKPEKVLMVARLDGPSSEIVRRIIDDSLSAEKSGLSGMACFDARWPEPAQKEKKLAGYAFYDVSIHGAAARVRDSGFMPVIIDDMEGLFPENKCGATALYCGWYSLAKYIDAFDWVPGAIGFHIASQECQTLRRPSSQVWCKRMLEDGASAVIGPVGEPYIQAFPIPELFFGLLAEARLTLVECYALSVPFRSWKMVLVGDPLYRPFRRVLGSPLQR